MIERGKGARIASNTDRSSYRVLDVQALSSALLQDLMIFLTLGTVVPLLAVVLMVSMGCRTLRWHH